MPPLRPILTFAEILGPGHLFAPRPYSGYCDWLPPGETTVDAMSCGPLCIAGDMAFICSAGCLSPVAAELLGLAGMQMPSTVIPFKAGEYAEVFAEALRDPGGTLVLQHLYPDEVLEHSEPWIAPGLLSYLNNKANLADLVLADNLPERVVVSRAGYFAQAEHPLPVVLKAVTDQSSGGGYAVMVCATRDDVRQAEQVFASCEQLVVEQVLDIVDNPCLNFAVMPGGEVHYLGFGDQDISPEVRHRGNWIDCEAVLPDAVVQAAAEPVRRGAAMGYRGVAGVDVAITGGGRCLVLDLNFRLNSSTPALLFAPAVRERYGATVLHFRKLQSSDSAESLARSLTPFVADGRVVPVTFFDAVAAGHPDKPSRTLALVTGTSREEVLAVETELAGLGIPIDA